MKILRLATALSSASFIFGSFVTTSVYSTVAHAQGAQESTQPRANPKDRLAPAEPVSHPVEASSGGSGGAASDDLESDIADERAKQKEAKANMRKVPVPPAPFTHPLRFDPEDNGFSIDNPQLNWEMTGNTKINLGGLRIQQEGISLTFFQLEPLLAKQDLKKNFASISFRWPRILSTTGTLSLETESGKKLWSQEVNNDSVKSWRKDLAGLPDTARRLHGSSPWGTAQLTNRDILFLRTREPFRACLARTDSATDHLQVCSRYYRANIKNGIATLDNVEPTDKSAAGFYINAKKFSANGVINFPVAQAIALKIVFNDGGVVEIASQPADPKLIDAVESTDGKEAIITGLGAKPLGKHVRIVQSPITHFWAPTGYQQDRVWQIAIPREAPTVRVLGVYNIPFTMLFTFDKLPKEEERVYTRETRSSGTYSSAPRIDVYSPLGAKISSKENSARKDGAKSFVWKFAAPHSGETNKARLLVKSLDNSHDWVANQRMYRSYPYELSARLTGFLATDLTFIVMAEGSGAAWFESLGFTQNSYVSKQRWGVAGRYQKGLTAIQSTQGLKVSDFTVTNLDLKYNILPGVWHRDEIVGALVGGQSLKLAGISASLVGFGGYWARTMPKIFDDLFNFVPGLDFPKYVDVELILYPVAMTTGITPQSTFNLNFHGRVFWSERFYGELGYGLRRYAFTAPSPVNKGKLASLDLSAAYGTLGIGFVF